MSFGVCIERGFTTVVTYQAWTVEAIGSGIVVFQGPFVLFIVLAFLFSIVFQVVRRKNFSNKKEDTSPTSGQRVRGPSGTAPFKGQIAERGEFNEQNANVIEDSEPGRKSYNEKIHSIASSVYSWTRRTILKRFHKKKVTEPGLVGLNNLGNTCFMNSSIQCLSAIVPLTDYFVSGQYKSHINRTNFGSGGELAQSFGNLLSSLWSGYNVAVSPKNFKNILEKYAPQFSGYQQHDSQELLAYLLDGLHEDLNRVKQYQVRRFSTDESIGRDERSNLELSEDAWRKYSSRNQSIIVDLFQGQYKSTISCPCGNVSTKFDPFMNLSCPISSNSDEKSLFVTLVRNDPSVLHERFGIRVTSCSTIVNVKQKLQELVQTISLEEMLVVQIYKNRIERFLADQKSLRSLQATDLIYVYQVPPRITAESHMMVVMHNVLPNSLSSFTLPIIAHVPRGVTNAQLYHNVDRIVAQYLLREENEECKQSIIDGMCNCSETPSQRPYQLKYMNGDKSLPNDNELVDPEVVQEPILVCWSSDVLQKEPGVLELGGPWINWPKLKIEPMIKTHPSTAIEQEWELNRQSITLKDCLSLFTATEKLSSDNAWYCYKCKSCQEATIKLTINFFPPILVIHLKRFQYNRYFREKLHVDVDFPLYDLDLSDFESRLPPNSSHSAPIYDLFAVSCHSGGLGGGHYTAFAKHHLKKDILELYERGDKDDFAPLNDASDSDFTCETEERWFQFNDSQVTMVSEQNVRGPEAYVLFYQRRSSPALASSHLIPTHPLDPPLRRPRSGYL